MKLTLTFLLCFLISGCSALGLASKMFGGSSSKSGGTDITANTKIGENKNQLLNTTHTTTAEDVENMTIHNKRSIASEIQQNVTIILIFALFVACILIIFAYLMRSPKEKRNKEWANKEIDSAKHRQDATLEILTKLLSKDK